ncbi:MAG: hypothetical protein NXH91_17190 [Phyllobacteriaceae bacterium]|jgi:hypothetical protein|nr:hypothetical protein [Phyllobacteriaceae bacterium]
MTTAKTEFQRSATPGEDLSRRLAYLATQDNGSVMTGGFAKAPGLNGTDDDQPSKRQSITAMEFLTQQEQIRQDQIARLNSQFDTLEQAARDALIDAENNLATILSNANRALDGRAVFKDKDGNIRDEDGQIVDVADVDMSDWDASGSTWEQKAQATERLTAATEIYENVTAIGDRLDSGDLEDSDLSALESDLDDIESDLNTFLTASDALDADKPTALADDKPQMASTDMTATNAVSHMKPL